MDLGGYLKRAVSLQPSPVDDESGVKCVEDGPLKLGTGGIWTRSSAGLTLDIGTGKDPCSEIGGTKGFVVVGDAPEAPGIFFIISWCSRQGGTRSRFTRSHGSGQSDSRWGSLQRVSRLP